MLTFPIILYRLYASTTLNIISPSYLEIMFPLLLLCRLYGEPSFTFKQHSTPISLLWTPTTPSTYERVLSKLWSLGALEPYYNTRKLSLAVYTMYRVNLR